jgi:hypothetical protein
MLGCALLLLLAAAGGPLDADDANLPVYTRSRPASDPPSTSPFGYLIRYRPNAEGKLLRESQPYVPREGDWIFFDDKSELWTKLYTLANTAPPFHAGIVVKKPDGELAVLESGPDDTLHVFVIDLVPRLYSFKGTLQVRQAARALTAEESARLTEFAESQKGKRYAMWRLLWQATPFNTKGGPLRRSLAHTLFNRKRWLCAEITVTGSAVAGLTDPKKVCGSNTYPLDIIDDHLHDLKGIYEEAAYWSPDP